MTDWTPEIAFARLIEAADIEWRMPAAKIGPAGGSGFWPSYTHTRADQNGWGEKRYQEERAAFYAGRTRPTAVELSRWEEVVFDWRKLMPEGDRTLLGAYVRTTLSGRSFSGWCNKVGLNRRTAYRRIDKALQRLSASLCKQRIFLRMPDLERVSQLVPETASQIDRLESSAAA